MTVETVTDFSRHDCARAGVIQMYEQEESKSNAEGEMKPDGMLVEMEHLEAALQGIASRGCEEALADLKTIEPALADFIGHHLVLVAGKMALSGAPTPVVAGVHGDLSMLVLVAVQSLRRGHYQYWKDTMSGTRLAQLDEQFGAKPRRRRKRKTESDSAE